MSEKTNKLQFSYSDYKEQCLTEPIFLVSVACILFGVNAYPVFKRICTNSYSSIGSFLKVNGVQLLFAVLTVALGTLLMIMILRIGIHLLKESPKDAVMVSGMIEDTFGFMSFVSKLKVKKGKVEADGIVLNGTKYYLPTLGEFEIGDTVSARVLPKSKLVLEMVLSEDNTVTETEIVHMRVNKVKFDYDLYFQINCMFPFFADMFFLMFFAGCIHGFIRYPEKNPLTFDRIEPLIMLVVLSLIAGLPLMRGGIHLFREKEKDAVIISGTISEVFDLPQIGSLYSRIYPNKGYGEGIVLGGIKYYLPDLGGFTVGDRVSAKVLPKSRLVLEMVLHE